MCVHNIMYDYSRSVQEQMSQCFSEFSQHMDALKFKKRKSMLYKLTFFLFVLIISTSPSNRLADKGYLHSLCNIIIIRIVIVVFLAVARFFIHWL